MLFKVEYPNNTCSYVTRHGLVSYLKDGTVKVCHLTTLERVYYLDIASCIGFIDKVIEPERKMFWLAWNNKLMEVGAL